MFPPTLLRSCWEKCSFICHFKVALPSSITTSKHVIVVSVGERQAFSGGSKKDSKDEVERQAGKGAKAARWSPRNFVINRLFSYGTFCFSELTNNSDYSIFLLFLFSFIWFFSQFSVDVFSSCDLRQSVYFRANQRHAAIHFVGVAKGYSSPYSI